MFGDEIFVGVQCRGSIRGRKGDTVGGGEDGLDEVVGWRALADDGQGTAGDRASHQVGVVAGGVDNHGDPVSVDVRNVRVGGGAVGEAQVEDGDLPALPPRLANGRRPGNGGVGPLVLERGLDAEQMIEAAAAGELKALVVGGVDVRDFDDPGAVRAALDEVPFLVSLEVRASEITDRADVVLPVAPAVEKNGTFINWEGRLRPFGQARSATSLTDRDVLVRLTEEFDGDLGITALADLYAEVNPLMEWDGTPQAFTPASAHAPVAAGKGEVLLASHKPMIDAGRLQDGAPWLAGSARRPVLLASAATLAAAGITPGADATLETGRGTLTLPAAIADLPDSVAWVPECSTGSVIHENLGGVGTVATLRATQEVAR